MPVCDTGDEQLQLGGRVVGSQETEARVALNHGLIGGADHREL